MGKISDKEKENIILKAVEAIQESINQIQVKPLPGWSGKSSGLGTEK